MLPDISVANLVLFPIKSLDGVSVREARFTSRGALEHDREFALYDDDGHWINGKRTDKLNLIRSEYDLPKQTVRLRFANTSTWEAFHLIEDQRPLEQWFSSILGYAVRLRRDLSCGFPDDTYAPGPTIISSGTIVEMSSWFSLRDHDETRRRFRANIELSADEPFWEDRLFANKGSDPAFLLGKAKFFGVGPCKRCVVPTRESRSTIVTPEFQRIFMSKRDATLPIWSTRARFGQLFYRVAVNTRVDPSAVDNQIHVGDKLCFVPTCVASASGLP